MWGISVLVPTKIWLQHFGVWFVGLLHCQSGWLFRNAGTHTHDTHTHTNTHTQTHTHTHDADAWLCVYMCERGTRPLHWLQRLAPFPPPPAPPLPPSLQLLVRACARLTLSMHAQTMDVCVCMCEADVEYACADDRLGTLQVSHQV
jgi:hypothetical protein